MFDIIVLILLPLIIGGLVAFFISWWNNRFYGSSNTADRVRNVSRQPRYTSDSNHKEFLIEDLMSSPADDGFCDDYVDLFTDNIQGLKNTSVGVNQNE